MRANHTALLLKYLWTTHNLTLLLLVISMMGWFVPAIVALLQSGGWVGPVSSAEKISVGVTLACLAYTVIWPRRAYALVEYADRAALVTAGPVGAHRQKCSFAFRGFCVDIVDRGNRRARQQITHRRPLRLGIGDIAAPSPKAPPNRTRNKLCTAY